MDVFHLANLSEPPQTISIGSGDLPASRLEWIQSPQHWTVIFYHHVNVAGVNAHSFAVESGDAVLFPPGSRGSHVKTGDDTFHWVLTFPLPGTTGGLTAIPLCYRGVERFQKDLERAGDRLFIDARAVRAFAWHFMWAIGRDRAVARVREELYAAEDFILRNLSQPLLVAHIAEASGKSPRQLLRTFREEHGTTIQEFIRRKRVREATRLLSTTSLAVKDVAARVGVPDLQAFNKLIREETGVSPRAFRQRVIEERDV